MVNKNIRENNYIFLSRSAVPILIFMPRWSISALLLLYDVTNKPSFDNIRAWLGEIKEYAQDDVVIMLLGKRLLIPTAIDTKIGGGIFYD